MSKKKLILAACLLATIVSITKSISSEYSNEYAKGVACTEVDSTQPPVPCDSEMEFER